MSNAETYAAEARKDFFRNYGDFIIACNLNRQAAKDRSWVKFLRHGRQMKMYARRMMVILQNIGSAHIQDDEIEAMDDARRRMENLVRRTERLKPAYWLGEAAQ